MKEEENTDDNKNLLKMLDSEFNKLKEKILNKNEN